MYPNVLIFLRPRQAPTGGTKGTTVNHIAFTVKVSPDAGQGEGGRISDRHAREAGAGDVVSDDVSLDEERED